MRLRPPLRKFVLSLHLIASVGWIGAVAAYLVFDITTISAQGAEVLRASYYAMDVLARWVIVPLALSALATGLIISLATRWGLFRHYWVLISLALTIVAVVVLLVEVGVISGNAAVATNPSTSLAELQALPSTLPHSVGGLAVLVVIHVLNVYKPKGLTRHGWRKQRDM